MPSAQADRFARAGRLRGGSNDRAAIALVAGASAAALLPPAYRALVRLVVRDTVRRLRRGDVDAVLRIYRDDTHFVFPGDNSWSGELRGKAQLEPWFRRFVRVGLQLQVHEILVSGPPWSTTVCARFTDHADSPDGRRVYENRGVIFLRLRWGRVVYEEANEDTERIAEFDRYLADHESGNGARSQPAQATGEPAA